MAGNYNLSEGALQVIMKGGNIENPIMQVLGSKKINSGSSDKERFRILLSDGKYTISFAMLTTQINDTLGQSGLENFSVVKIKKYITSVINNTGRGEARVLLILDLEVLHHGQDVGRKIGNPTTLSDKAEENKTSRPSESNAPSMASSMSAPKPTTNGSSMMASTSSVSLGDQLTHPISSLSPYHNRIQAPNHAQGKKRCISMEHTTETLSEPDDQFTSFGSSVAHRLKALISEEQRVLVKKMISEVLFLAEMNQISYDIAANSRSFVQETTEGQRSNDDSTEFANSTELTNGMEATDATVPTLSHDIPTPSSSDTSTHPEKEDSL